MTLQDFYKRVDFNGGLDREIDEWKILDIHEIPAPILEQHEIDFYCCNDKEVYLLRLRNRMEKKLYVINDDKFGCLKYLIAELPIERIGNTLLKDILNEFMNLNK